MSTITTSSYPLRIPPPPAPAANQVATTSKRSRFARFLRKHFVLDQSHNEEMSEKKIVGGDDGFASHLQTEAYTEYM